MHSPLIPAATRHAFDQDRSSSVVKQTITTSLEQTPCLTDLDSAGTPKFGFFGSAASFESSLVTPVQSPGQNDFSLTIVAPDTIGDTSTDFISVDYVKADMDSFKRPPNAFSGKYSDNTASINSFSHIERLFQDSYGTPVSSAIDELLDSLTKLCVAPPDPVTVFSSRVFFGVSSRSVDNYSPRSSIDATLRDVASLEEDITSASLSPEDLSLGLAAISLCDDDCPLGNDSYDPYAVSASHWSVISETSMSDIGPTRRSSIESFPSFPGHYVLGTEEIPDTPRERDNFFTQSSTVRLPEDSDPSLDRLFADASPETSSVQSSLISTPTDAPSTHPQGLVQDLTSIKMSHRSARVTAGLAIDVRTSSASIISLESDSPDELENIGIPEAPHYAEPDAWAGTIDAHSLPTQIVSNVADTVAHPTPPAKHVIPVAYARVSTPPMPHGRSSLNPNVRKMPSTAHTGNGQAAPGDASSRRVGLRGGVPRYRFATALPPGVRCVSAPGPDARTNVDESVSRRVGLHGAHPRQRFVVECSGDAREMEVARERAIVLERHRARALFLAQRDAYQGPGLRPLLLPLRVAARNSGAEPAVARSWGLPF
ncbi:hypothetical protein HYPSUDRAFT_213446 [Hypholoma sublateritium FD-334 SS-4]|uniref:Uncharacterized protein n=1 Tax=Hypholoma sublateritium (strain FD-334 SS-4) TaxID=945553 RepID=A0A0D2PBF7_HYPSF|nr:hypothetical protein HYPSUDRAFT_213446 [Hypholoma sublateritium FD-334 SS-4]